MSGFVSSSDKNVDTLKMIEGAMVSLSGEVSNDCSEDKCAMWTGDRCGLINMDKPS